jgi:RNA polymerase sigma factor (TIGR02999 family)
MSDITRILKAVEEGDPHAPNELWSLVYNELRRLAAIKMAREKPGQTLNATALVNEAYLRLFGKKAQLHWQNRGHFFAVAARAMSRILIEIARRKKRRPQRRDLDLDLFADTDHDPDDLLDLEKALEKLEAEDVQAANVARLRLWIGLSVEEAGEVEGLSRAKAFQQWKYARAWLSCALKDRDASLT